MRKKLLVLFTLALGMVLPPAMLTTPADAKPVAKDPLAVRKPKSKAATKSSGAGSKYLRMFNLSSQAKGGTKKK